MVPFQNRIKTPSIYTGSRGEVWLPRPHACCLNLLLSLPSVVLTDSVELHARSGIYMKREARHCHLVERNRSSLDLGQTNQVQIATQPNCRILESKTVSLNQHLKVTLRGSVTDSEPHCTADKTTAQRRKPTPRTQLIWYRSQWSVCKVCFFT